MATDAERTYADRAASFYAREYGFPPVTGRVLGYLAVCDPPQQTIDGLAEALLASRSAIAGAVRQLEDYHAVLRTRAAGERVDRVGLNPAATLDPRGFDGGPYKEQAELAREALSAGATTSRFYLAGRPGGSRGPLRLPRRQAPRGAHRVAPAPPRAPRGRRP